MPRDNGTPGIRVASDVVGLGGDWKPYGGNMRFVKAHRGLLAATIVLLGVTACTTASSPADETSPPPSTSPGSATPVSEPTQETDQPAPSPEPPTTDTLTFADVSCELIGSIGGETVAGLVYSDVWTADENLTCTWSTDLSDSPAVNLLVGAAIDHNSYPAAELPGMRDLWASGRDGYEVPSPVIEELGGFVRRWRGSMSAYLPGITLSAGVVCYDADGLYVEECPWLPAELSDADLLVLLESLATSNQ